MTVSKTREVITRVLLLLSATIVGVLVIEFGLLMLYPISFMNVDTQGASGTGDLFLPDRVLGFRPALGTHLYDRRGILFGRSIYSKADGASKLLLIGDSVTARGQIVNGLAKLAAPETTSFLNGGIEGYNIEQEVEFFFRYQSSLKPDAIIHQMHINDLHASRHLSRGRDGTVRLYSPKVKPIDVNPTLYRYSQLYRFLVANFRSRYSKVELKAAAVVSLRRMRDYTRQNGIAYHLVLFPVLQPLADWTTYDKETRDYLLGVARELELDAVDLLPVAEQLIATGIDPQSRPGDTWHPNQIMGDAAAKYMTQKIPSLLRHQLNSERATSPLSRTGLECQETRRESLDGCAQALK